MAWQLIYTSSARLLEAGRTGFGTVARHRAISALLTGKLESISQFARLPGYDPDRVIFSHRVLEAGGRHFHVLSSIRSAGSDYSGRTNHIAHHLMISEEEARDLAQRSVTPVDVLHTMEWRSSWDTDARYLEDSEEVDLSQLPPASVDVWSGVTGLADHARLPWSPQAAKGCCIVLPNHADATLFAGEALLHNPARSWEISFTTHLEPNDGLSDFRWVFLYPDSVALSQAEQSARPLYDLTTPSRLPEPPAPLQPAATAKPSSSHQKVPSPSFAVPSHSGMDQGSQWGLEKLADSKTTRRAGAGERVTVTLGSGAAPTRERPRKWAWIAASLVGVVVVVAVVTGLQMRSRAELEKRKHVLVARVDSIWEKASDQGSKKLLHDKVEQADAKSILDLEREIEDLAALVGRIDDSIKNHRDLISPPGQTNAMDSTDEAFEPFQSLPKSVRAWLAHHDEVTKMMEAGEVNWTSLSMALEAERASWEKVQSTFHSSETPQQSLVAELQPDVIKLLEEKTWRVQDYGAAEKVVNQLGLADREEIENILACWKQLSLFNQPMERLSQADYKRWQKTADLPAWLKKEVQNRAPLKPVEPAPPAFAVTVPAPQSMAAARAIQVPTTAVNVAEKPKEEAKNETKPFDTYFVLFDEIGKIASPELPIKQGMVLEVQGLDESDKTIELYELSPIGGAQVLGKPGKMSGPKESFSFVGNRLAGLPGEGMLMKESIKIDCKNGFRIKPKGTSNSNFEIIALKNSPPKELLSMNQIGSIESAGANFYKFRLKPGLGELKWHEKSSVSYYLRPVKVNNAETSGDIKIKRKDADKNEFETVAEKTDYVSKINTEIKQKANQLKGVDKRLESLRKEKFDLETKSKLAEAEKKRKLDVVAKDIADMEAEKNQLNKDIESQNKKIQIPPPPPPKPSGQYHLFAKVEDRYFKLCLVDLK